MYNIIYITNIPAFYKINLFNKIAERKSLLVIFLDDSNKQRNEDFYKGERKFEYISLGKFSVTIKFLKIISIILKTDYKQLIIGGWDSIFFWSFILFSPKSKNSVVIESSIYESNTTGIKGFVKRFFLKRIKTAYVSGKAQKDLVLALGFKGEIKTTKGVGIFNLVKPPEYYPKNEIINFIYVGRLSEEKNLKNLIHTFNELNNLQLIIVGFGSQEDELKSIAKNNITFYGAVDNINLQAIYRSNDVFILPSLSEPWGLVVEEAFNNGLPVIVSNKVGCSTEIVEIDKNGLIFNIEEEDSLKKAILQIIDPPYYNSLRKNVCKIDFEKIAKEQIDCYF